MKLKVLFLEDNESVLILESCGNVLVYAPSGIFPKLLGYKTQFNIDHWMETEEEHDNGTSSLDDWFDKYATNKELTSDQKEIIFDTMESLESRCGKKKYICVG